MEILRKTVKSFVVTLMIFFALTLVLATLIMYTGFKEDWTRIGLIALLTMCTFFVGFLEGTAVGEKGVLVGIIAAAVFIMLILVVLNVGFRTDSVGIDFDPILVVMLLSGAVGGVLGTNRN